MHLFITGSIYGEISIDVIWSSLYLDKYKTSKLNIDLANTSMHVYYKNYNKNIN